MQSSKLLRYSFSFLFLLQQEGENFVDDLQSGFPRPIENYVVVIRLLIGGLRGLHLVGLEEERLLVPRLDFPDFAHFLISDAVKSDVATYVYH